MAWKSSSSKNKPSAAERSSLSRLESVRRQREPFRGLSQRIVHDTLQRWLPAEGRVVEIGMGDGQLFERLPEAVRQRTLHTEPQAAASRDFRRQHPELQVAQAPAERLPVEAGGASAVIGLCVMDVVPDGAAVAAELARALRPGGRFIHWLDMSTVLAPVVAGLSGTGLVPFPNVFSDPAEGDWPEDLFLMPREQLELLLTVLATARHPLSAPLTQYLRTYSSSPLAVGPAAAELIQLQDSAQLRSVLKQAFQDAFELAPPAVKQQLASFRGRPVSSARHFENRLRSWFGEASGFRVEESVLARAWETLPLAGAKFPYMSSSVGEQRSLPYMPDTLLCPDAPAPRESDALLELAVFVFVASRI